MEHRKNKNPYEDIIHLPHLVSKDHIPMSIADRAAQFSPFAALTGYDGAIKETARLTDQRIELDESSKTILDEKLRIIQNHLNAAVETEFVFFKQSQILRKRCPEFGDSGNVFVICRTQFRGVDDSA